MENYTKETASFEIWYDAFKKDYPQTFRSIKRGAYGRLKEIYLTGSSLLDAYKIIKNKNNNNDAPIMVFVPCM